MTRLVQLKLAHTVVWLFLVACIVGMPVAALRNHFGWAAILGSITIVEGLVLIANGWRCPITDIAARYTDDRTENFDIYMPVWLARHNKTIFTAIFAAGLVVVIWRYLTQVLPPSLVR